MGKFKSTQESRSVNHIYNQAPSRAAYVLAWAFVVGIALLAIFLLAINVLEDAGWNGERFVAEVIFWPAYVAGLAWMASRIWNYFAAQNHQRRIEMEQERRETLAIQHKFYSTLASQTREITPELKRRNEFIIAVVYAGLEGKPIGKRPSGESIVLSGDTDPVGKDAPIVNQAFAWMVQNDVCELRGNRYQLTPDTTIARVESLLYTPVLLNSGASSSS